MKNDQTDPQWIEPLDAIANLDGNSPFVLLYSGMQSQGSGRYSFLAHGADHITEGLHFHDLEEAMQHKEGRWYGYLGYGLRHDIESLTRATPAPISLPPLWMMQPKHHICWDHQTRNIDAQLEHTESSEPALPPAITELSSNMSKAEYLEIVKRTLDEIHAGTFYQANITRKFYGQFEEAPNPTDLFRRLCDASPAPFSAYINMGNTAILSSSPEGFLQIDAAGNVTTRPIKGTAKRAIDDELKDKTIKNQLADSAKDKAENLMIVDLMRNDLSRACDAGSVHVSSLYDIYSYQTVHQMVSTVTAKRSAESSSLDVIKACFPPGSMTGAPKIAAMDWCNQQEKQQRGVYSGAIGWIDHSNACDLSVVIRTLIVKGTQFEFQVGGGIVADSDPELEWEESLIKARGIAKAIGLDEDRLRAL